MIAYAPHLKPGDRIRIAGTDVTVRTVTPGYNTVHIVTDNDRGGQIVFEREPTDKVIVLERQLTEPTKYAVDVEYTAWSTGNQDRSSSVMAREGFRAGARALARLIVAKHPELATELMEQI